MRDHLVGTPQVIEIVDIKTAEIDLKRLENISDRDVFFLRLHAINVCIKLRNACPKRAERCRNLRILAGFPYERLRRRLELFRERPEVVDGHMALPDKPGLGLELREDTLEKYGVKIG